MSSSDDVSFVIEETELDLEEKSGPSPWVIVAIVVALLGLAFGIRTVTKRRLAAQEATPTEIGELGDSAFESRTGGA
jgi:hypothetical protein